MEDKDIVDLYWQRSDLAISETERKYGRYCRTIARNICGVESRLFFSDGTSFSTGGALTSPIEDGVVRLCCGWGEAVNIGDVQKIVLGDLVLWENR